MDSDNTTGVIEATNLDPNRQPTAKDGAVLGRVWRENSEAHKAARSAEREYLNSMAASGTSPEVIDSLRAASERAYAYKAGLFQTNRVVIEGLPLGTTAKGGATRQTVVLEFYGLVNRTLGARLSATDARRINKAAFGG